MRHQKSFSSLIYIATGLLLLLQLSSCQKEIHLNLSSTPPQLVVEGAIENGQPPYLFLSTSLSFFSTVDLGTLQNSFVHGAAVTLNDGTKTVPLKEYSIDSSHGNKVYVYSLDTTDPANLMIGVLGKTYKLSIVYNGQTYTSTAKIPYPKGLDSLWFAEPTFKNDKTPKNAVELFGNYLDPDSIGNYVKYFTRRNNEIYFPGQLFNDEVVNGKRIPNIGLQAGYESSSDNNRGDSLAYFYPGDTVYLKWCEIDKGVYTFWNTYDFAQNAVGNPFSSPINVQSNVSNGALGIWAAYGSIIYTKIVP